MTVSNRVWARNVEECRKWQDRIGYLISFTYKHFTSKGIVNEISCDLSERLVVIMNTHPTNYLSRVIYIDELTNVMVYSESDLMLWKLENEDVK